MSSAIDHSEAKTTPREQLKETNWGYALEWLLVTIAYITFTKKDEDGKRVSKIGLISRILDGGSNVILRIEKCAFREVGNEETGDEWQRSFEEEVLTIEKSSAPISISENGYVSFEFEGVSYFVSPEPLNPTAREVLAALFN